MCNKDGFGIISDIEIDMRHAENLERIEHIFRFYVDRQLKLCMDLYVTNLNDKLSRLDQVRLELRLNYVMQKSMNKCYKDKNGLFSFIKSNHIGFNESRFRETLESVPKIFADELNLEDDMKAEDLSELATRRYLIEPCDIFTQVAPTQVMFAQDFIWIPYQPLNENENEHRNEPNFEWLKLKFYLNWLR